MEGQYYWLQSLEHLTYVPISEFGKPPFSAVLKKLRNKLIVGRIKFHSRILHRYQFIICQPSAGPHYRIGSA